MHAFYMFTLYSVVNTARTLVTMADMRSRLAAITASLEALAAETQRPVARLVAVSKTMPVPVLAEAHALGLRRFGEN